MRETVLDTLHTFIYTLLGTNLQERVNLEILQDEEMMAAFRESVEALEKGETVAWEDVRRELGLLDRE